MHCVPEERSWISSCQFETFCMTQLKIMRSHPGYPAVSLKPVIWPESEQGGAVLEKTRKYSKINNSPFHLKNK